MAQGFYREGASESHAAFHFFFRKNPYNGGFAVACGLENLLNYVESGQFKDDELSYLSSLQSPSGSKLFDRDFINYLGKLKFNLNISSVPEGTVIFNNTPIIRVEGNLLECQMLETALSNIMNFQTLIATKASRMFIASKKAPLLEFGLRRAQGFNGGDSASRAAYIGGFEATSNVSAGKKYGIPVRGTHSHSWVLSHDSEEEAFRKFSQIYPKDCVFLVDTFNTINGVEKAIKVSKERMASDSEFNFSAIRLDSGDLAYLSNQARELLDKSGFANTKIIAGNDLDEYIIESLIDQQASIDVWSVGTKLVTSYDQPSLGGVYKLTALEKKGEMRRLLKMSEDSVKINIPGVLQFRRYFSTNGKMVADAIYDIHQGTTEKPTIYDPIDPFKSKKLNNFARFQDMLQPYLIDGKRVIETESIQHSRERTISQLNSLDKSIKRFINPHTYPAGIESDLHEIRQSMINKIRTGSP